MASFQYLLESPFRWIAHWIAPSGDHRAAGPAGSFFRHSGGAGRSRRERVLRRDYLNG
ncbi:hypothetical protein [Rhizobium terrae]|uniref:hypothetical protein n=1 Tax=Rhizobium terrae TaxID=2171756 RepID=UPI0013C369DD|nr:hypothetical protein [Rhizobium terrae]